MSILLPSLLSIRGERSRRSLRHFIEWFAWPVLQPGTVFQPNWHIDAICDHLQAMRDGHIRKLIINMPFRMLKSTIVSQALPAWDWIDKPSREFMTASYARDLAMRDAVESRRIIESAAYQAVYGDRFRMTTDQNVKTRYENDKRGKRIITSTDSAGTGFGGDWRLVDDPVSAREADSMVKILDSIEWWKGTFATRANDPADIRVVLVHQRLNVDDLTGYCLAKEKGWEHLVLPFRFDEKIHRKMTSLGFVDPRKTSGELIHPARVNEQAAKELEDPLGSYHRNAQLQQNPEPRGGIIFLRDWWKYWNEIPADAKETIISVDCTFKDLQTSDYVAIQGWSSSGAKHHLRKGRIKERMGFHATVQAVRGYRARLVAEGCNVIAVLIEDKANGSAVIETLKGEIEGVLEVQPDGGKSARAYAMTPSCEAGNVVLPDPSVDPTIESFIGTCSKFTGADGGEDDEVDAMTQAINWLRARNAKSGLQHWLAAQAAALKTAA